MNIGLVVFLFILNFVISWFNAWSVGKCWLESKAAGGFTHFVTWCGAIMSASGFTWCYTILLALGATHVPYKGHMLLTPRYAGAVLELMVLKDLGGLLGKDSVPPGGPGRPGRGADHLCHRAVVRPCQGLQG
jgi:hypothetical protein